MRPPNKSAWCTSRTMDGGRGKGNDLASLLVGPEQSLQSGVPGEALTGHLSALDVRPVTSL